MKSIESPTPKRFNLIFFALAYYLSAKACFLMATTYEGITVVWLPNAITLTALLYYRGQRYCLFVVSVVIAEMLSEISIFPWYESIILGLVNTTEATIAYLLMKKSGMSSKLESLEDMVKFIVAGPLISSFVGTILGCLTIQHYAPHTEHFFALIRLWWFGDALGLMILCPLLLTLLHGKKHPIQPLNKLDVIVSLFTMGLLSLIIFAKDGLLFEVLITPSLILPSMLYLAARTNPKWTAIGVFLIYILITLLISLGKHPFGEIPLSMVIVYAQEFILTLSISSLGLATLITHIRDNEKLLEARVIQRTDELNQLNNTLQALSLTDGLTGIANRRRFDEQFQLEWTRALRSSQPLTLAIIDIDWFKSYNDLYGHQAGDDCLCQVSKILESNLNRSTDFLARYGGEEFVFISAATDTKQAISIAQNICDAFKTAQIPHAISSFGYVTVSIGFAAMTPKSDDSASSIFKAADQALYLAKAQGRNRVVMAENTVTD